MCHIPLPAAGYYCLRQIVVWTLVGRWATCIACGNLLLLPVPAGSCVLPAASFVASILGPGATSIMPVIRPCVASIWACKHCKSLYFGAFFLFQPVFLLFSCEISYFLSIFGYFFWKRNKTSCVSVISLEKKQTLFESYYFCFQE